jgi:predicted GNAT family acetyltransferase
MPDPVTNDPGVQNDEPAGRFVVRVDGHTSQLQYRQSGEKLVLVHTEVAPELEGRGVGGRLARAALEHARAHHLRVVPLCPFVAAYIRRHPEYQPLVHPEGEG